MEGYRTPTFRACHSKRCGGGFLLVRASPAQLKGNVCGVRGPCKVQKNMVVGQRKLQPYRDAHDLKLFLPIHNVRSKRIPTRLSGGCCVRHANPCLFHAANARRHKSSADVLCGELEHCVRAGVTPTKVAAVTCCRAKSHRPRLRSAPVMWRRKSEDMYENMAPTMHVPGSRRSTWKRAWLDALAIRAPPLSTCAWPAKGRNQCACNKRVRH